MLYIRCKLRTALRLTALVAFAAALVGPVQAQVLPGARAGKRWASQSGLDFSSDSSMVATCGDRVRVFADKVGIRNAETGELVRGIPVESDWSAK